MSAPVKNVENRGHYILNNHIILESIVKALPDLADICALSLVSHNVHCHTQHLFPLAARKISFASRPETTDKKLFVLLNRYLRGERGSKKRKAILDGGGTISVGGGAPGTAYTGSWRNLTDLDLSGTRISTVTVKMLITASSGGKIPGLAMPFSVLFDKDFSSAVNPPGYSLPTNYLLKDQGLRLKRLSVKDCPNVHISPLVYFLKRVLTATTQKAREKVIIWSHRKRPTLILCSILPLLPTPLSTSLTTLTMAYRTLRSAFRTTYSTWDCSRKTSSASPALYQQPSKSLRRMDYHVSPSADWRCRVLAACPTTRECVAAKPSRT